MPLREDPLVVRPVKPLLLECRLVAEDLENTIVRIALRNNLTGQVLPEWNIDPSTKFKTVTYSVALRARGRTESVGVVFFDMRTEGIRS